jgi:hypothetical protein
MATGTANITALYEDVVADLMPYFDNSVLLPNPAIITNIFNITGGTGNQVKIPVTNAWTAALSAVTENSSILGVNDQDFIPDAVSLSTKKRGAGTLISEESLEDGGMAIVRQAVLTRLSRSLAQATDTVGFRVALSGAETALTDISGISGITNYGYANTALTGADLSIVMSPEAMAYAVKREPTVKMFNDVDKDNYQMVATVRNGFARVYTDQIAAIAASNVAGAAANISATLDQFSAAVAGLRGANAPTDAAGFYIAVVTPVHELALAKQLNGVGGLSTGAIGALSDLGNQALLDGLIGQAVGCRFFRSNNLPKNLLTA